MNQCKIAVFRATAVPMKLELVDIPELEEGQVLVQNEFTTICRSDLNTFDGKRKEKSPTILGHEIVGRVVGLGPNAPEVDQRGSTLSKNDRITWAIYASDPESELAKSGIPQKGPDLFKYGHELLTPASSLHGGLSEYTLLRANTPIVKVEESMPLKLAAIINCAVATVAGAIRLAGPIAGKRVIVSGVGMLGMIGCAMAKAKGAKQVIAIDANEERLSVSKDFGVDVAVKAQPDAEVLRAKFEEVLGKDERGDVILEFSGVAHAMESTLALLGIGGTVVWVGATYPQRDLNINAERVVRHLWTLKGLHNYNQSDLVAAVAFMEKHHQDFPFTTMIHDQFTLDEVNEAFQYGLEANPFRVGIKIN